MTATKSLSYRFASPVSHPPPTASTTKMTTEDPQQPQQQQQEQDGGGPSDQHLQLPGGFGTSSILQTDPFAGNSRGITQTDPLAGSAKRISPQIPERRPSRQASTGLVQVKRVSSIDRQNVDETQRQAMAELFVAEPGNHTTTATTTTTTTTTRGLSSAPVPHDITSDDEMQPKRSPSGFRGSLRGSLQVQNLHKQVPSPPIEAATSAAADAVISPSGGGGTSAASRPSLVAESNTRSTVVSPKQTRKTKKSSIASKDGNKLLKSPKQKTPKKSPKDGKTAKKKIPAPTDLEVPLLASPGGSGDAKKVNASMKSPKRKTKKVSSASASASNSDVHHPTKVKKSVKKKDGNSPRSSPKTPKRKMKKKVPLDPEKIEAKLTKVEAIMSKMARKQGEEAFTSERFAVLLERQEKYQRQLKRASKGEEIRQPSKSFSNLLQRYRNSQASSSSKPTAAGRESRQNMDIDNRRSLGIEKMKSHRPPERRTSFEAPPPLTAGPQALKSMRSLVSVASKRSIRTLQPKRSDKVSAPRLKELETIYRPKVFDKTPEDIVIIKKVLARNFVFKKVKDLAAEQLMRAFEPITTYQKGDIIINQGAVGNYFYILGPYGSVAFEDSSGAQKQKQANIPGTAFGVLGVLYRNPSKVTIRVSSDESRIYRVDQVTFRYILQSRSKAKTLAMQAVTKVKAVNRLLGLLDTAAIKRRLKSRHLSMEIIDTDDEDDDEVDAKEEEETREQKEEAQHEVYKKLKEKEDHLAVKEETKNEVSGEEEVQKRDSIVWDEKQADEQEGLPRVEVFVPKEIFEESGRTSISDPADEDDISLALDEISASGLDDYLEDPDLEYSKYMEDLNMSRFSLRNTITKGAGKQTMGIDMFQKMTVLGEGQFGEVWLVQPNVEEISDKMFALKIQSKEDMSAHSAEYSVEEAIRRECRVLETLCHPFIVDFVHSFDDLDNIYLIMSLIRGVELWNCIHREQDDGHWVSGLQEDHCKFYAILIADTLNFMHRQNTCHRDIKPENVMIDHTGYPILVDFGFAKELPETGKTFTMCGTPKYTAPEVIANEGHGCPVDLWALGVVIYEMLSGENPFWYEDISDIQLLEDICTADPYPIEDDEAECSDLALDIICKLLHKDPQNRLLGGNVTSHPWFNSIDLSKARRMELPAPWAPACSEGLLPSLPAMIENQN